MTDDINKIAIFQNKEIRKVLYNGEWWFSVVDVIAALTDSNKPRVYWSAMKTRVQNNDGFQLSTICIQLKLESSDGKKYITDCSNTEGLFRVIQSIPSPKAEPFKRWLARVGYERIQEIENPELAQKRIRATYLAKGYEADWIERRIHGINTRSELTEEWNRHGIDNELNYAILTSEISKATFDITPSQHKKLKGLKHHNLRDHMSKIELLFTELGEESTKEIIKSEEVYGLSDNKTAARRGGSVAGTARKQLEKETGKKVVSDKNFLKSKNDKLNLDK